MWVYLWKEWVKGGGGERAHQMEWKAIVHEDHDKEAQIHHQIEHVSHQLQIEDIQPLHGIKAQ